MESVVQIGYWKIRGLAQPIRYVLEHLEVPYEERMFNKRKTTSGWDISEWTDVKFKLGLDFPNLPYMIDGDIKLTQSTPIIRHLCRKHCPALLGKTPSIMAQVDMLMDFIADHRNNIVAIAYGPQEKLADALVAWEKGICGDYLDRLTGFLGDKEFLTGDLTAVDFMAYEALHHTRWMVPNLFRKYAPLAKYMKSFEALPSMERYMKSDRFIAWPVNSPNSAWGSGPKPADLPSFD
eukprot:Polyplicarium_translucidae@DN5195_c0_g1_i1.p1